MKFGSEEWTLKKRDGEILEGSQLKSLRHLLGITKYEGGPKNNDFFFKIIYFSEHFQILITLKILSLRINTIIPPPFPLFRTVLELLQSDSLQCLRRFFPHLFHILKTLSFKVPLHFWKQENMAVCQVRGVGGVRSRCLPVFLDKLPHAKCTLKASEERISQQLFSCESMLPTRRLFDDDQMLLHREFFESFRRFCLSKDVQIAVGLQVACHHV